jgi:putative aldouronate transport system substrate-binding protein
MRKLLVLLACFVLVTSMVGAKGVKESEVESMSNIPSYLNLESSLPVIKNGQGEEVVLKVTALRPAGGGDWKDLWIGKYIDQFMNVNLKVEQIPEAGRNERVSLMFGSGDLPDLMLFLGLTPPEVMNYGVYNDQFMDLAPFINPTLTPNMYKWKQERPDAFATATTPDGRMYTLPMIREINDPGSVPRLFINQVWLKEAGLKTPETLDEFLTMLRAFKARDPKNVIPMGGGFTLLRNNLGFYFLNALGYVTDVENDFGTSPAVRNGVCELPAGNAELFKVYLETMHTLYSEGLVSKEYFVIDETKAIAQLVNGQVGVFGDPVYTTGISTWADWWAAKPLTSKWNNTPVWNTPAGVTIGNFAIGADSKYPLTAMRIADHYFADNSRLMWIGPATGSPEAMGLTSVLDCLLSDSYPNGITDIWTYLMSTFTPMPNFGSCETERTQHLYLSYAKHPELLPDPNKPKYDLTEPDAQYRASVSQNMLIHSSDTFPTIYYMDEETTLKMADLKAVIEPFVKEQVALFMNGTRPLSEFDKFQKELESIGFREYEKVYVDIWNSYKAALK